MRHMLAVGERNFQSEGDRYKENITLSLLVEEVACDGFLLQRCKLSVFGKDVDY